MISQIKVFLHLFLIKVGESTIVTSVPLEKFHYLASLPSPDAIFSCFAEVTQKRSDRCLPLSFPLENNSPMIFTLWMTLTCSLTYISSSVLYHASRYDNFANYA